MSNQTFGGQPIKSNYWVSARGADQIYFNKLSDPPLSYLNHGLLYELNDGHLYYNGEQLDGGGGSGDVSGPTGSTDSCMALWDGIDGKTLKDSSLKITEVLTGGNVSGIITQFADDFDQPIVGYATDNGNFFAGGCQVPYQYFWRGDSNVYSNIVIGNAGASVQGDGEIGFNTSVLLTFDSGGSIQQTQGTNHVGYGCGSALVNGIYQTAYGAYSLNSNQNGSYNCAYGFSSMRNMIGITGGNYNTCYGSNSGTNWINEESSNIILGPHPGVLNENNTVHIGNWGVNGTGEGEQHTTYIHSGDVIIDHGNFSLAAPSSKLLYPNIASGASASAASMGTVTLVNGVVTVNTTAITSLSQVIITRTNPASSTALGSPYMSARTSGSSFTITSANITLPGSTQTGDQSTVFWMIIN